MSQAVLLTLSERDPSSFLQLHGWSKVQYPTRGCMHAAFQDHGSALCAALPALIQGNPRCAGFFLEHGSYRRAGATASPMCSAARPPL